MTKTNALKYTTFLSLSLTLLISSLNGYSQSITEKFSKLTISENFDSVSGYWTTLANGENLFIMQDGEYILQRRAAESPYAIIANFQEQFSDFRAIASLKLDDAMSEEATVGFLFMMQEQGQGGFLVEINNNKEYRLRQIANGVYRYITGTSKNGGWEKTTSIKEGNIYNMIEIVSFNKNYDLSINGTFIRSFSEPAYKTGKFGFIIGPKSRGKIDFLYIFTNTSGKNVTNIRTTSDSTATIADQDIIELAESIIALKTQVNGLQEENDDLKKVIAAMKSGDQEKDVTVRNLEKQLSSMKEELKANSATIDSLSKSNKELKKYQEIVGSENGDIVISLSKALKAEKEKNQKLQDEINNLKKNQGTSPVKSTGGSSESTPAKKPANKSNQSTFTLPDE